jgi:1-acyl-sn-glycerol-3-phosphate acyltransferase
MKKHFARLVFWLFGWKLDVRDTKGAIPSVVIAAPHTSNWDFIFALGAFWQMEIPLRYFIKQTYTRSIFGFFFHWTGAIGVDQKNRGSGLAAFAADLLRRNKDIVIMVPAEGTRKRVDRWRTGFYRISLEANVPIALGYLDYKKKVAGVTRLVHPTGDFEKDMQLIEAFYKEIHPKHPELYNAKIY